MANSIYGAADSTLVSMSYHAGMANVPLDQTAIFAQREENLKNFTGAVSKLFENQWADHKATEKMRVDLGQQAEDILLAGGNVNEFQMDNHHNTVHGYKERLDQIKYDDTLDRRGKERARQRLELEMGKYKNGITEQSVLFEEMVNYSANGYIYNDMGSKEADTWNAILKDYNEGTNEAKQTVEKGTIMYEFNGTKMSLKDIKKGLSKHDPEFQTEFATKLNEVVGKFKSFQQEGKEVTPNQMIGIKDSLFKNVGTLDQVRNLANAKLGNNAHSFEQILYGQAKTSGVNGHQMIDNRGVELIYLELDKLSNKYGHEMFGPKDESFKGYAGGQSAIDMNDDGVFDQTDMDMYHDPANAKMLIEKIHEDKDLYKELVVNFTMESAVKDVWADGTMDGVNAVNLELQKNQAKSDLSVEEHKQKTQNTQNITGQETKTAKKARLELEAMDKEMQANLKTMDFKNMAGKPNRVVSKGNGKYHIFLKGNFVVEVDEAGKSKDAFKRELYNYMMQNNQSQWDPS